MRSLLKSCFIVAVASSFAAQTRAQDPIRKIDPSKPIGAIVTDDAPHGAAVMSPEKNDRRIVRWLKVDNQAIADCAQLAADHSHNDAIKKFAADVAKQHEDFTSHFGDHQAAKPAADVKADAAAPAKTATLLRDDGASRGGSMVYRPTDFVAVKEHVCNDMRDFARKQMEALNGPDFDRAFMAHMVFGHHALIASVDALDDSASDALKPQLKQLRDMLEQHLARAAELQQQVHAADTTAARPTGPEVK